MTEQSAGAGAGSADAVPQWRWRRPDPEDPFPLYAARVPGALGDDGATVELTRSTTLRAICPVCGRRRRLWSATLRLREPWGAVGAYRGCTRPHAVALVPRDWSTVAEGYALAALAAAAEGRTSTWHQDQIARYRRQSERAAWLHDQSAASRTLALTLWVGNDLSVEETGAITAAVLAAPPSPPVVPGVAAPGG